MRRLAIALLVPLLVAGCLGIGDEGEAEPERQQHAVATDDTGGLEGIVTNAAIEPIPEAEVLLIETGETTTTSVDGSYALSELTPATYTLHVAKDGYQTHEDTVSITQGEITVADIVLTEERSTEAYTQTLDMKGFFECGFAAGYDASAAPAPLNESGGLISSPTCATVNSLTGNATNDRFDHYYQLDPPIRSMIVETDWDPGAGSLSDSLWVDIVPQNFHCGNITMCEFSFLDHWGESPLRGEVGLDRFEHVQGYFHQQCDEGADEYCGYEFFEDGWDLWIRVYPRWECQPAGPQACVMFQQEFTHYITAFYHEPAPEGYSAL